MAIEKLFIQNIIIWGSFVVVIVVYIVVIVVVVNVVVVTDHIILSCGQ